MRLWMVIVLVPSQDLWTGVAKSRASVVSFGQSKSKMVRVCSHVVSSCCETEEVLEELLYAMLTEWFDLDVFEQLLDAAQGDVSCSSNSALSYDRNPL